MHHLKPLSDAIPIFNEEVKFIYSVTVPNYSTRANYTQAGSRYFKQKQYYVADQHVYIVHKGDKNEYYYNVKESNRSYQKVFVGSKDVVTRISTTKLQQSMDDLAVYANQWRIG